jgi:hypothetical protein
VPLRPAVQFIVMIVVKFMRVRNGLCES